MTCALVDGPVRVARLGRRCRGPVLPLWHAALRHTGGTVAIAAAARRGRDPRGRLTLLAAALVAAVHWFLIYVVSVFPAELPRETLAWSVAAVVALLLCSAPLGSGAVDLRQNRRTRA